MARFDFDRRIARQLREERDFQAERAAPGMNRWRETPPPPPREIRGGPAGNLRVRERDLVAGDLMTENPEVATPGTPIADVARRMRDLDVGIIPVVGDLESRRLAGVVTDRDITVRLVAEGKEAEATAGDCMSTDIEACHPGDGVRDVLHVMERQQVRRVPVTDHDGTLVGIIAQADLAVEYGAGGDMREVRVEAAIERISEPARPRRGRWRG